MADEEPQVTPNNNDNNRADALIVAKNVDADGNEIKEKKNKEDSVYNELVHDKPYYKPIKDMYDLDMICAGTDHAVIFFYATYCGYCKRFNPTFDQVAELMSKYKRSVSNPIKFYKMDGNKFRYEINAAMPGFFNDDNENPSMRRMFPTILFKKWNRETDTATCWSWDYRIDRNARFLMQHISEAFEDPELMPHPNDLDQLMTNEENPEFVFFYTNALPIVPACTKQLMIDRMTNRMDGVMTLSMEFYKHPEIARKGVAVPVNDADRRDFPAPAIFDCLTGETHKYRDAEVWLAKKIGTPIPKTWEKGPGHYGNFDSAIVTIAPAYPIKVKDENGEYQYLNRAAMLGVLAQAPPNKLKRIVAWALKQPDLIKYRTGYIGFHNIDNEATADILMNEIEKEDTKIIDMMYRALLTVKEKAFKKLTHAFGEDKIMYENHIFTEEELADRDPSKNTGDKPVPIPDDTDNYLFYMNPKEKDDNSQLLVKIPVREINGLKDEVKGKIVPLCGEETEEYIHRTAHETDMNPYLFQYQDARNIISDEKRRMCPLNEEIVKDTLGHLKDDSLFSYHVHEQRRQFLKSLGWTDEQIDVAGYKEKTRQQVVVEQMFL
jgi:thiol-disulfide isomerase/thioredoxin